MRYALGLCLLLLAACGGEPANNRPADVEQDAEQSDRADAPSTDTVTPEEPVVEKWKYQDDLDRAVAWILENQKEKGDWGYMEERPYDI